MPAIFIQIAFFSRKRIWMLEVSNFIRYKNFQKIRNGFSQVFLGNLKFKRCPPHSSYIQKPHSFWVKLRLNYDQQSDIVHWCMYCTFQWIIMTKYWIDQKSTPFVRLAIQHHSADSSSDSESTESTQRKCKKDDTTGYFDTWSFNQWLSGYLQDSYKRKLLSHPWSS